MIRKYFAFVVKVGWGDNGTEVLFTKDGPGEDAYEEMRMRSNPGAFLIESYLAVGNIEPLIAQFSAGQFSPSDQDASTFESCGYHVVFDGIGLTVQVENFHPDDPWAKVYINLMPGRVTLDALRATHILLYTLDALALTGARFFDRGQSDMSALQTDDARIISVDRISKEHVDRDMRCIHAAAAFLASKGLVSSESLIALDVDKLGLKGSLKGKLRAYPLRRVGESFLVGLARECAPRLYWTHRNAELGVRNSSPRKRKKRTGFGAELGRAQLYTA